MCYICRFSYYFWKNTQSQFQIIRRKVNSVNRSHGLLKTVAHVTSFNKTYKERWLWLCCGIFNLYCIHNLPKSYISIQKETNWLYPVLHPFTTRNLLLTSCYSISFSSFNFSLPMFFDVHIFRGSVVDVCCVTTWKISGLNYENKQSDIVC